MSLSPYIASYRAAERAGIPLHLRTTPAIVGEYLAAGMSPETAAELLRTLDALANEESGQQEKRR